MRDLALPPEAAFHILGEFEHLLRVAEQFATILGERDAAGVAMEQARAKMVLEITNLPRDGGVAFTKFAGDSGERTQLRNPGENPKAADQIHRAPPAKILPNL